VWPSNACDNGRGPIVYFRAENGLYTNDGKPVETDPTKIGYNIKRCCLGAYVDSIVVPAVDWRLSQPPSYVWMNPKSFQIFCSGLDMTYTTPPEYYQPSPVYPLQYPTGDNYGPNTYDDITNFSNGTLEDAMP
jgi:hypothetical protein